MELLLNLVWLLMAAGVLWTWRTRWVHQRQRTIGVSLREWTAVSVALILLFFAVSMSDDLHMEMALFEDSATSRRGSALSIDAQHPPTHNGVAPHGTGPLLAPLRTSIELPSLIWTVVCESLRSKGLVADRHVSDRSPPTFFV
jgi:hypothetical protein